MTADLEMRLDHALATGDRADARRAEDIYVAAHPQFQRAASLAAAEATHPRATARRRCPHDVGPAEPCPACDWAELYMPVAEQEDE